MPTQAKEYLEAAVSASQEIAKMAKRAETLKSTIKAMEDKHGITPMKEERKQLIAGMEMLAYRTVSQSVNAQQGKLFEEDKEE